MLRSVPGPVGFGRKGWWARSPVERRQSRDRRRLSAPATAMSEESKHLTAPNVCRYAPGCKATSREEVHGR